MPNRIYSFTTVFQQAFLRRFRSQVNLPVPTQLFSCNFVKSVQLFDNWNPLKTLLESSAGHRAILSNYELDDLNGDETVLITEFEPKNQNSPNISSMENLGKYIRHAILLSWRFDTHSSGYIGLEILSDNTRYIWSVGARAAKHYSRHLNGLTLESLQNIKIFYPIIFNAMFDYNQILGIDIELEKIPSLEIQVRNRITKALRWFDFGLMAREFDVRFICFSIALEALITNEHEGKSVIFYFKQRVNWLAEKAGLCSSICILDEIYELRSRLSHGDMASKHKTKANHLLETLHFVLTTLLKYLMNDANSLAIFASNSDPNQSIIEIREFFKEADS